MIPSVEVSGVTSHSPPSYPALAFIPVGTSFDFRVPLLPLTDNGTNTVLEPVLSSAHLPFSTLKVTFATSTVGSPILSLGIIWVSPFGSLYVKLTSVLVLISVPDTSGLISMVCVWASSVISPISHTYLPSLSCLIPLENPTTSNFSVSTMSSITASVPAGLELICFAHNFSISLNCLA